MSKVSGNALVKYLQEAKEEFKKVTWPSRKDTIKYTVAVAAISVVLAVYFGVLDELLARGVAELIVLTQ